MEHIADKDLIARIRRGNQRAFAILVHRHTRAVYGHIAQTVWSPQDVEDLVQTVFLNVHRHLLNLREPDRFQAWLHALVRNAVRSHHRRRLVQLRLEDALQYEADVSTESHRDMCRAIRTALESLSPEHRQVIAHHYFKGYSYAETADLLDLSIDTVRGRLKRARARLKKELHTMTCTHPQTLHLDRSDLTALRRAAQMVSTDPKRPILHGIYLDTDGKMVVTNGHYLLVRTSENLKSLAAPAILGPWTNIDLPDADGATLTLGETTATIAIQNHPAISIPLIEGPYVKYEQVIPQDPPLFQATVSSEALQNALDLMTAHMHDRHPVDPSGACVYCPKMELHLSAPAQTLTFMTSRDLGYNRMTSDGKSASFFPTAEEPSPGGVVDWTFQTQIPVRFDAEPAEETLCLGVNFTYVQMLAQAMEIHQSETLALSFLGRVKPIILCPSTYPDWLALLMPLRLETPEPVT